MNGFLSASALLLATATAAWAGPQPLRFSGMLSAYDGSLMSGSYPVAYRFYDASVGGKVVLRGAQYVTAENGRFRAQVPADASVPALLRLPAGFRLVVDPPNYIRLKVSRLRVDVPQDEIVAALQSQLMAYAEKDARAQQEIQRLRERLARPASPRPALRPDSNSVVLPPPAASDEDIKAVVMERSDLTPKEKEQLVRRLQDKMRKEMALLENRLNDTLKVSAAPKRIEPAPGEMLYHWR